MVCWVYSLESPRYTTYNFMIKWENFPKYLFSWAIGRISITKTYLYNFDPIKPHFCAVKLGFTGLYIIFLIYPQKHRLWVLVRNARVLSRYKKNKPLKNIECGYSLEPPRGNMDYWYSLEPPPWCGSNEYRKLCFEQKYETIGIFIWKTCSFWWWNFQYIWTGVFFVMVGTTNASSN